MPKITLNISDLAFRRLRSETMVRTLANAGESQDIIHHVARLITNANDGETVNLKLRQEKNNDKHTN